MTLRLQILVVYHQKSLAHIYLKMKSNSCCYDTHDLYYKALRSSAGTMSNHLLICLKIYTLWNFQRYFKNRQDNQFDAQTQ